MTRFELRGPRIGATKRELQNKLQEEQKWKWKEKDSLHHPQMVSIVTNQDYDVKTHT